MKLASLKGAAQMEKASRDLDKDGMEGPWCYDEGMYILTKVDPQHYSFEETVKTEKLTCFLSQDGEWYQGQLSSGGKPVGFLRVRLAGGKLISNYKQQEDASWDSDITATKAAGLGSACHKGVIGEKLLTLRSGSKTECFSEVSSASLLVADSIKRLASSVGAASASPSVSVLPSASETLATSAAWSASAASPAHLRTKVADTVDIFTSRFILHCPANLAHGLTFFGPGMLVLPLIRTILHVKDSESWCYFDSSTEDTAGLNLVGLQKLYGKLDPSNLLNLLMMDKGSLDQHLQALQQHQLMEEVSGLTDCCKKALGRLKILQQRALCAVLGISAASASEDISKAVKIKLKELHTDKGGDAELLSWLYQATEQELPEAQELLEACESQGIDRDCLLDAVTLRTLITDLLGGEKADKLISALDQISQDPMTMSEFIAWLCEDDEVKQSERKNERQGNEVQGVLLQGIKSHLDRSIDWQQLYVERMQVQQDLTSIWLDVCKLEDIIKSRLHVNTDCPVFEMLFNFCKRFAGKEVENLRNSGTQDGLPTFSRFLQQGAVILCAAGAIDPQRAVQTISKHFGDLLMSAAASKDLKHDYTALENAVLELPSIMNRMVSKVVVFSIHMRRQQVHTDPQSDAAAADGVQGQQRGRGQAKQSGRGQGRGKYQARNSTHRKSQTQPFKEICLKCGSEYAPMAKFCRVCGREKDTSAYWKVRK